jgi:hypothetical protein
MAQTRRLAAIVAADVAGFFAVDRRRRGRHPRTLKVLRRLMQASAHAALVVNSAAAAQAREGQGASATSFPNSSGKNARTVVVRTLPRDVIAIANINRRYRHRGVVDESERAKNRAKSKVRAKVEHSIASHNAALLSECGTTSGANSVIDCFTSAGSISPPLLKVPVRATFRLHGLSELSEVKDGRVGELLLR